MSSTGKKKNKLIQVLPVSGSHPILACLAERILQAHGTVGFHTAILSLPLSVFSLTCIMPPKSSYIEEKCVPHHKAQPKNCTALGDLKLFQELSIFNPGHEEELRAASIRQHIFFSLSK